MPEEPRRLLFVCLGNICRSPSAEGICRVLIERAGLTGRIETDSAGTGDWHLGYPPDPRAVEACAARGVQIEDLRARLVVPEDFLRFDRILAMDQSNLLNLRRMAPPEPRAALSLMLDFADGGSVPDPYYGGRDGFETMLDLLEASVARLVKTERALLERT